MTELPPDDSRLSSFLRRYQPAPPSSSYDLEDCILTRIEQNVQQESKGMFWFVSSAVVAGMLAGWMVHRYSSPPQITANVPELESFILDNWETKATEARYFENSPSLTNDWLLLTNPKHNYLVFHPR